MGKVSVLTNHQLNIPFTLVLSTTVRLILRLWVLIKDLDQLKVLSLKFSKGKFIYNASDKRIMKVQGNIPKGESLQGTSCFILTDPNLWL